MTIDQVISPPGERQRMAADPRRSHWVSANAGSGKTRVLIDRVVRMLCAGTPPQRILCVTYTKAAATEMQNRLFRQLGEWAMMPDAQLVAALTRLGVTGPTDADALSRARRLFAMAIETPGGLKIQTIHAFCASLLRRFPLEAGVAPGFRELDDTETRVLRLEVLEELAQSEFADLVQALAPYTGDDSVLRLIDQICQNSVEFDRPASRSDLCAVFGLPADLTENDLMAQVFLPGSEVMLRRVATTFASGKGIALKDSARILNRILPKAGSIDALEEAEGVFLYGYDTKRPFGPKIDALANKDSRKELAPGDREALDAFAQRVADARPLRTCLAAVEKSLVLHRFASAFLPAYRQRKTERGLLDFDDLVLSAGRLIDDPGVAQWVLFRLDGGIDHILVDEAQDTSPRQWSVIRRLSEEFMAGEGARGAGRTIFVVGDKKQSIYSFQGADVAVFGQMQQSYKERLEPIGLWGSTEFEHSFRSSEALLRLVDLTFDDNDHTALGGAPKHIAFHNNMPGRVDLWPVEVPDKSETPANLFEATFAPPEEQADERLAKKIAQEIRRMIDDGVQIPVKKDGRISFKPVDEGDFLILVRKRTRLFNPILRACKAAGLAVAGSDRMKLGAELAVNDILALLRFLVLPEDDLSFATALRSPLLGWSEKQLFQLAANRPERMTLWEAFRSSAASFPDTSGVVDDLRRMTDFLRPYDLIERILTQHGGRAKLIGRLGSEAAEGIDALVAQALSYEETDVPSLTGFLVQQEARNVDIKRQVEAGTRALRVMTVHGAKGLEAPIVILPDTADQKGPSRSDPILFRAGSYPLWKVSRDEAPPEIERRSEDLARRQAEETTRLLYVALTRAESWLIVAAAGNVSDTCWYSKVKRGMERAAAVTGPAGAMAQLRVETGTWPAPVGRTELAAVDAPLANPDWLMRPVASVSVRQAQLSPSALPGAKTMPGESTWDEGQARRHGTWLHLLLEHLPNWPQDQWNEVADNLLSSAQDPANRAEIETVLAEAKGLLASGVLKPFVGPESLAEVEVAGKVAALGSRMFAGTVDRLIVRSDRITVIDYKSNRIVPSRAEDVPDGILRQMGVYAEILGQAYPDRHVECVIVWTKEARVMVLPPEIVRSALASTPIP